MTEMRLKGDFPDRFDELQKRGDGMQRVFKVFTAIWA